MFKITYYDHELGDMEAVNVAISFESAVADILIRLGRSKDYQVEASGKGESCSLQISRHGVVIAAVAECDVVCYTGGNNQVHDACARLRLGDDHMLVKLFAPICH
jgi:hypothetical protein